MAVATESGFDLTLTEEQELVQRAARDFATEKVLPRAAEIDEQGRIPAELLAEMGMLGFMGTYVPERYGGSGLDVISYVLAAEEINRACASTGVAMCSHVSLAVDPILRYGSDAQKERFLPSLARGERIGCFALSEPASGSDAAAMRTSARRDGDSWVLNGTKNFITNGSIGEIAIVFAQTHGEGPRGQRPPDAERSAERPAQKHKGIAAFIVEKGTPGFSVGKLEKKLGIRGSDTAQLVFQDCRVAAANVLGEIGEGFKIALSTLDGGRISIAAQAVGIARACLEDALAYAKQREAFGKKIAEFQAIQWMLADMATEIDAARLLTWRAAALKDAGEGHILAAAEAKLFASDVAVKAARDCVQIFGGYGYLRDFPAERHYRDAKITEIYEGTSEIMKLVIAEEILRE
ncbi:MAG TPA: acyl-CoA dehydrogenase [Candidatus Limnocylindria bacterium]|jgi:alkylation response protein AidB-like acyl-CoA dehydrogenase|nr:acyl-CoA dehydrogenase [Candidatus Limnocylindria bacterium]